MATLVAARPVLAILYGHAGRLISLPALCPGHSRPMAEPLGLVESRTDRAADGSPRTFFWARVLTECTGPVYRVATGRRQVGELGAPMR